MSHGMFINVTQILDSGSRIELFIAVDEIASIRAQFPDQATTTQGAYIYRKHHATVHTSDSLPKILEKIEHAKFEESLRPLPVRDLVRDYVRGFGVNATGKQVGQVAGHDPVSDATGFVEAK